jgi:hypothetical protein
MHCAGRYLQTVLRIHAVSLTVRPNRASRLTFIPIRAMIAVLLRGVLTDARIDELAQTIETSCAPDLNQQVRVAAMRQALAVLVELENQGLHDQMHSSEAILHELLLSALALHSPQISVAEIAFSSSASLAYIQCLHIRCVESEAPILIIGTLPELPKLQAFQVDLSSCDVRIAQISDVMYRPAEATPRFNLRGMAVLRFRNKVLPDPRSEFLHKAGNQYDLDVYVGLDKYVGSIATRRIAPTSEPIIGCDIVVRLPALEQIQIHETTLRNSTGVQVRLWRMFEPKLYALEVG